MSVIYYDVKKAPFKIYGLDKEALLNGEYRRIPASVAEATSANVVTLSRNTAGGRIRFKTDSDVMYIKAKMLPQDEPIHSSAMAQFGFDIYVDMPYGPVFCDTTKMPISKAFDYECEVYIPKGEKEITVNMPLYGSVIDVEIGLGERATVSEHSPYKYEKPIVIYGSSITQGGCVSRPGKLYSAIISRKLDHNFTCLGFSGSAKAEDAMIEYLASLDMAAFVSDYDHNAPSPEYLRETHHKLYEKIREKHPDIPYYMITKPDFRYEPDCIARRTVVMESYLKAYNKGDRKVYFIDGSAFFNGLDMSDATVDRCHPTDDGQRRMAEYICDVMRKTMHI